MSDLNEELKRLEGSLAFDYANQILDSECPLDEEESLVTWRNTEGCENEVDLVDALRYLELRGLLVRHAEHRAWVQVLEESEATV